MYKTKSFSTSLFICFIFFFFILSNNPAEKTTSAMEDYSTIDIVNRTCKRCNEKSKSFIYDFCQSSLQVIPASHVTNLQGLAVIGMELALENATNTISSIRSLLNNGSFESFAMDCLQNCLELYSNAVVTLVDGVASFLTGHYGIADVKIIAVMEAASTCEEAFTQKKGEVSPLSSENFNLFHLCDIALCIIHWLTLAFPRS